jgi:F420H(2)-dependent quinone reductase
MAFDTPAGTRGTRQPPGLILRWVNKMAARRIRRTGKMTGFNALVLTTVGRKSGLRRTTPVGWFPGPDGSWLITAAVPRFADYQRKTDRELPVIRLVPRSGQAAAAADRSTGPGLPRSSQARPGPGRPRQGAGERSATRAVIPGL